MVYVLVMDGNYDRQKRYRQRKSEQDPEFKKKESERINGLIKKKSQMMTEDEKEEKRLKKSEYMRQYRRRKNKEKKIRITANRPSTEGSVLSPKSTMKRKTGFRTKPALRKAVKKLFDRVPLSPSKRQGAVSELAKQCGLVVSSPKGSEMVSLSPPSTSRAFSVETKSMVRDFFFQTNVVYTSPGQKDEMTVWEGGKKVKLRKYYLELTVKEAYAVFKEQHPNVQVGLSKFFELKPPNVIHMAKAPNDQCKCVTHENFRLMLKPLKVEVNSTFWQTVLCDSSDLYSPCWKGDCSDCQGGILLLNTIAQRQSNTEDQINWQIWESLETSTKKGKEVKRIVKVFKGGCVGELKELVEGAWSHYLSHVRTKRIMSKEFQDDLTKDNVLILQCDFAMDYNTKDNSREVQSAIYGRQNVTIFTAAVRHKRSWISYSVITNSDKYKNTVRVCMLQILKDFLSKTDISEVDKFIVWSDGPSCEFRNQYCTGKLLYEMSQLVNRVSYWKYFAASHGKGVCDGIGGALKARVAEHARGKHRDDVIVQNHKQFFEIASKYCPKVTMFTLDKEEVNKATEKDKPWDYVHAIEGVSTLHVAKCGIDGTIQGWRLPGEGQLKPVHYREEEPEVEEPEVEEPEVEEPEVEEPEVEDPEVEEPQNQQAALTLTAREWYVVQFEDGTTTMNYLCQLLRIEEENYVVNSFISIRSSKKKLFKKYPAEEIVNQGQFLVQVEKPEMQPGGKVLVKNVLNYEVK